MKYLETSRLLLLLITSDYVYAQQYPAMAGLNRFTTFVLYNPRTGEQLDPQRFMKPWSMGVRNTQTINDNIVNLPTMGSFCSSQKFACECCVGVGLSGVQKMLCILLQLQPNTMTLGLYATLNDRKLLSYEQTIDELNDNCVPIFFLPIFACLRTYNTRIENNNLYLCISLVFKLSAVQLFDYKLACFRFNFELGIAPVPQNGQFRRDSASDKLDKYVISL